MIRFHLRRQSSSRVFLLLSWLVGSLVASGCRPASSPPSPATVNPAPPLRLLVIDAPELAKVIKREWGARSEGELTIRELSAQEFSQYKLPRLGADAVLFPSDWMGELAGREWLAPIPDEALDDPTVQYRDIFSAIRKQEVQWGEETYAVPLGSAPLVLFYRHDIFEGLKLKPPQNWAEYKSLAEQLAKREVVRDFVAGADTKWSGTCEPLEGAWGAQLLLARAAPYCKHRSQFSALFDYRTLKPLIAGPPFVRALQELTEAVAFAGGGVETVGATEAFQRIRHGECAMAIGFLEASDERGGPGSFPAPPSMGIAPLPGARDVYNFRSAVWEERDSAESQRVPLLGITGRLGSLTKESRQPAAAVRLLLWLSGPEMSPLISSASSSTAPFRVSHGALIEKWTDSLLPPSTAQEYATVVQQVLSEPNCLMGLRIPGTQEYIAALSEAVRTAVEGKASAEEALANVARQWEALNASHDLEKQRQCYMRSIGLKP